MATAWWASAGAWVRRSFRARPTAASRATTIATAWHPQEDRFIYNGGQELVPVDSDAMAIVDASGHYDLSITAGSPR
jgi:hypothetical protein